MIGTARLAANLKWLFTELPFEQRFAAAAAAGFTAVEYPDPYPHPAATLRRRLSDAGLTQVLINSPMGGPGEVGTACLPERRAEFRAGLALGLGYAVELGASFLHVPAGKRPAHLSRDRAFACYVANIAWAAQQSRDSGVRIVLEAQNKRDAPGFLLDDQAHAAAAVEAVGGDHVGLLFDVYHAQQDEPDLLAALAKFLPLTSHVQIADVPGRGEPGTGDLPWPAVFEALRAHEGWIGCEYRPHSPDGLGWTRQETR
ncbi:TIM barrel protein [Crossiella sp. SN42]|uniref:hydroxypyruvate isomerase family protein n=1 Tax=Crossiella sp. SN42 TaxID=2944808 RepID=UPI00207CC177|nr:TIM barrel protein [Crossiella sp. SN42]MCO1574703.1 TIM barrel protein [Crossiella sp. SN42]